MTLLQKIYTKNLQGLSEEYTNKSIDGEIINLVTTITGFSKLSDIFNELDDGGETPVWKCVQEMEDEWVQKGVAEGERKGEIKGMQKERTDSNYYNDSSRTDQRADTYKILRGR